MKRTVAGLTVVVAVALIAWAALTKRGVVGEATDDEIIGFIESSVFPEARKAVGARCPGLLASPVTVGLRLECQTTKNGVTLTKLSVQDVDGGAAPPELVACVTEAVTGLKKGAPKALRVPAGRAYELDATLELGRLEHQDYVP